MKLLSAIEIGLRVGWIVLFAVFLTHQLWRAIL